MITGKIVGYKDTKALGRRLRLVGALDARDGKPIEAFYSVPDIRHSESNRASYEIGYRNEHKEMLKGTK